MAGDPFTDVSVENYNLNPPTDDGAETPANEITWEKHKSKLGDPLKTAIEDLNTNVGGAVDKLSGGVTSVSNDYTVLAGDQGKTIVMTAASKTITTPAAATVTQPFRFWVLNLSSGDLTLDGNGTETIDGALTVTIPKNRGMMVETDGSNWKSAGQNWPEKVVTPIALFAPTGRLTLTTAVPVLSTDVTGQATVYYTPYVGGAIMLYDGADWKAYSYAELSQALSDATKSPSAAGASKIYDMFVWVDGSTMRCTRGPGWDVGGGSATARGSGAGSTALTRVNGVLMNSVDISNGPAASRGVYVGTIATDGSTQLNMMFAPAAAAGGTANRLDVWNAYNRVHVTSLSKDSTNSWTYSTATWRAANAGGTGSGLLNRVTAVFGLAESAVEAVYTQTVLASGSTDAMSNGVGLDVTNNFTGVPGTHSSNNSPGMIVGRYLGVPGVGQHFFQGVEFHNAAGGAGTWYGDNNAPTYWQAALSFSGWM